MNWYNTAIMLEKLNFERLTCNHQEINFYFKKTDEKVHIFTLVDATKRYYYEESALTNLKEELERKFLLRGSRDVEVLFIVYTKNLSFYKKALDSGINLWLADMNTNKLMIFENQPGDFLDLKAEIENSLTVESSEKKIPRPYVTIGLVTANVFVYLFMYILSRNTDYYISVGANCWTNVFLSNEYYRLFTCMFIHSGSTHLVNNMLSLAVMGNETETKLGHIHFAVLYLICGLLSSLASAMYYMHTASQTDYIIRSVGASGAIFGIYGAYIVITLLSRSKTGRPISVPRILLVTFILLFSGFTGENIDNMAHLAGLIVGIIISFIYCKCDKSILK